MRISKYIETLVGEHEALAKRISILLDLGRKYPDLMVMKTGSVQRLCSAQVNNRVDTMDIESPREPHATVVVWPFLKTTSGERVYSNPPGFVVGHANHQGFGVVPLANYERILTDAGISMRVIGNVRRYLDAHPDIEIEEEDL